jgi:hypothetical protein
MSIVFDDAQLRTVSKEVIEIPQQIVLLNNQKTAVVALKADLLLKDNGNKAFFDHYQARLASYYTEQADINGVTHTAYLEATLIDSAKQVPGNLHFPISPPWVNMQPKLIDSVVGNPTGVVGFQTEIATLPILNTRVTELTSGFNDGVITTTLYSPYVFGQPLQTVASGFVSGQRVIVDSGGVSLMGLITLAAPGVSLTGTCAPPGPVTEAACLLALGIWTPDPSPYGQDLTITVLGTPLGSLPAGSRVRNWHPGFINSEREGTTTPYAPEAMVYMRGLIDAQVSLWKTRLDSEKAALIANPASGPEGTQVTTAKNNVQAALNEIALFQAAPVTGLGTGRYGDNRLNPLQTQRSNRSTQAPARVTEILSAYGTLSQAGDGSYTGTGNWASLFKWIELRAGKAGGTLFSFYSTDLTILYVDQKIAQANTKQAEYATQMVVAKVTVNSTATAFITVASVAGLLVSDSVSLIDDDSVTVNTTIVGIAGLIVQLGVSVPGYTVNQIARLVKLL